MLGLDFSYFDLEVLRKFVLGGLLFSVQLTIAATVGGVIFGTLLALMRLSGQKVLMWPAALMLLGAVAVKPPTKLKVSSTKLPSFNAPVFSKFVTPTPVMLVLPPNNCSTYGCA